MSEDLSAQFSRRRFLEGAAMLATAGAVSSILPESPNSDIGFITKREQLNDKEVYTPSNPLEMLSREQTDTLFDELNLQEEYPKTINKDAFYTIIQKPARIAGLFLKDPNATPEQFSVHCNQFFGQMKKYAHFIETDFVATLLMFQVSGDANSSIKAQQGDVRDEKVRAGMSLAHDLLGDKGSALATSVLRKFDLGRYYAMARLEGPVTLGIHDIELLLTSRGVLHVLNTLPETKRVLVERYFEDVGPKFLKKSREYTEMYAKFESLEDTLGEQVRGDVLREFVELFSREEELLYILTDGDKINNFQFLRTTTFWSEICDLDSAAKAAGYTADTKQLENRALLLALDRYKNNPPRQFVLEQLGNPKMIKKLKEYAKSHPEVGGFLTTVESWVSTGESIISKDREFASEYVSSGLEQDMNFQLFTGVALSKFLLEGASAGIETDEAGRYMTPNDLAFASFLANGDRESGPSGLLAGCRPLNKATLTFVRPRIMHKTLEEFITKVYSKVEDEHPKKAFKKFSSWFFKLIEERYFRTAFGINRYQIDANPEVEDFINDSIDFGYERLLITPPHVSWMRSFEATSGYIAKMT